MNWFHYTRNGNQAPFNFEGKDLINFARSSSPDTTIYRWRLARASRSTSSGKSALPATSRLRATRI